ncbi:pyridoxal phosphate-dependent aminotransferase [Candidatus Bathyarchaeota archaeon]|nr:MAG: pyridoxal phosphate-dependent aminotransferase [Candidatus Bathyarchaeota archaeon]
MAGEIRLTFQFLSRRAREVPKSGIREMFNIAQRLSGVINLSLGEPDFKTPQHIIKAAVEALQSGYTHYTSNRGLLEFREAVAHKLKIQNNMDVDPETEVMATVGSMGALSLTMLTIIDSGDEVLIPSPGYVSYESQVLMAGGKPVPYRLREENQFQPDLDEISSLITPKTKAIVVNSPSNPTGAVFDYDVLKGIADLAADENILVISDEAYERITYDGIRHISPASLPGMMERTISIFSFSKTYAMTGWRIGYAVANKEIISEMTKLQEHLVAHPSSISQIAATAALRELNGQVERMVREYAERRLIVMDGLSKIPGIRFQRPRGSFYIFPNIRSFEMSSEEFTMHLLREAKVIVVPGSAFGRFGEGYIRISYSISREMLKEAINRIAKSIEKLNA